MISRSGCMTDKQKKELKDHGSAAFPLACYQNDADALPVPWHWHDEIELVQIAKGKAFIHFGDLSYEISEGNGCFINAGALHAVETCHNESMEEHCIVFHPRLVGGSVDSVFWQKYIQPIISDRSFCGTLLEQRIPWQKEILSHIHTAFKVCETEQAAYELTARNELSELIAVLSKQPFQKKSISKKALRQNERMKQMLSFIQQHFGETVSIRQIAASASVSESECMRCFHQTIHTTPIAYLKNYRLQFAADLLKNTDLPVAVIASQCGFQEMSYFARSFRKVYQCAPSQYRN